MFEHPEHVLRFEHPEHIHCFRNTRGDGDALTDALLDEGAAAITLGVREPTPRPTPHP